MALSFFKTALPLVVLLAGSGLHAVPAAAQGMSGMAGMDMSGMDHGSMSMKGPMETMPDMQATGHTAKPGRKQNDAPQGECRTMAGMTMPAAPAAGGCGASGGAGTTVGPQPMPEAVRER